MTISADIYQAAKPKIWILVILAAVGPLAINIFVPSMPSIALDLDAPYATVQLGLSMYLLATAAISLFSGPLSDKYGRKPVLVWSLILFLVGSTICLLADNASSFLIGRIIQAASATGMVLSRAIVRDVYPRERSASMIGYVVMGMAVAPMIGPAIGGYIDSVAGWRWSFGLLTSFGLIALLATLILLPETNTNIGQSASNQIQGYISLATMPIFWLFVGSASFTSAVFFSFLGGGPAVSSLFFGQTPFEYGMYFSLCALGYAFGNGIAGRYSETVGLEKMMSLGAIFSFIGPVVSLLLFYLSAEPAAWMLFVPLSLIGLGNGMTLPNVTAATISVRPEAAGAASGLLGSLQIGGGGLASIIGGIVVGETGSPYGLCALLVGFGLAALIITLMAARMSRRYEAN